MRLRPDRTRLALLHSRGARSLPEPWECLNDSTVLCQVRRDLNRSLPGETGPQLSSSPLSTLPTRQLEPRGTKPQHWGPRLDSAQAEPNARPRSLCPMFPRQPLPHRSLTRATKASGKRGSRHTRTLHPGHCPGPRVYHTHQSSLQSCKEDVLPSTFD